MKILLDECVDRRLASAIKGHTVKTVPQQGWQSYQNGKLLNLAQKEFDIFITVDRNLYFQQKLKSLEIVVLVLRAPTNRLADLLPLVPRIDKAIKDCEQGEVRFVS